MPAAVEGSFQDTPNTPEHTAGALLLGTSEPLLLDCGRTLSPFTLAYTTAGRLNAAGDNAILIFHALTGDQHVTGHHPMSGKPGWWHRIVGSGRVIDPARYFVICANVLGGCMGSSGPAGLHPDDRKIYGARFPVITIADMVRAQVALLDALGIARIFAVIGGSMGGMCALQFASAYPERCLAAVPIATAARHSTQNIALHEVGRQAIMSDPDWYNGDYAHHDTQPHRGLAVARMAAHVSYLSQEALHRKFGRRRQNLKTLPNSGFDPKFEVEEYLHHQGRAFTARFDANSYLTLTRAMDYFDLARDHGGVLAQAFPQTPVRFCLIAFSSDWLFPTAESREIVRALNAVAADLSFVEITSDAGHDSFLLELPEMERILSGFLNGLARVIGWRDVPGV